MEKLAAVVIVPLGFLFFISGLVINLFQVLFFYKKKLVFFNDAEIYLNFWVLVLLAYYEVIH